MAFVKYKIADNAYAQLATALPTTATTITIKNAQNLPAGGNWIGTLAQYGEDGFVKKFEKVLVQNNVAGTLTVERGFGGNAVLEFNESDYIFLNVVAEIIEDIQEELSKLNEKIGEYIRNNKLTTKNLTLINDGNENTSIFLNNTTTTGKNYEFFSDRAGNFGIWNKTNNVDMFRLTDTQTVFYKQPNANNNKIVNVANPTSNNDAANKVYIDGSINFLNTSTASLNGSPIIKRGDRVLGSAVVQLGKNNAVFDVVNSAYNKKLFRVSETTSEFEVPVTSSGKITGTGLDANNSRVERVAMPVQDTDAVNKRYVTGLLSGKVSTEAGKGLSTNDYTTEEKNKLDGLNVDEYAKLNSENDLNGNQNVNGSIYSKGEQGNYVAITNNRLLMKGLDGIVSEMGFGAYTGNQDAMGWGLSGKKLYLNWDHIEWKGQNWTNEWTSWTPTIITGGTTGTITNVHHAKYKVIGKTCHFSMRIEANISSYGYWLAFSCPIWSKSWMCCNASSFNTLINSRIFGSCNGNAIGCDFTDNSGLPTGNQTFMFSGSFETA